VKRILIIGSNGLVGQALVNYLQDFKQYKIIACSKNQNINENLNSPFESLDITNHSHTDYIISLYKPDVVINTAAISSIDICKNEKEICSQTNFNAVKNISEFCSLHKIHFIHFSSDFVFQGTKSYYSENDIPEPVNYYGQTKLLAETEILNNNINASIIRVELVYGYFKNMKRQNIVTWVINSLKQNKQIKVVSDQYRTPTYNYNVAQATKQIIDKHKTDVFNIGGTGRYSIYEIALQTTKIFRLNKNLITPVLTSDLNENELRPMDTSFNIQKAINILNYNPDDLLNNLNKIKNAIG